MIITDVNEYLSLPYAVVDVETTNKDFGDANNPDNELLLTSVYQEGKVSSVWGDEYHAPLSLWLDQIEDSRTLLVGHNIKFDLMWLKRAGLRLENAIVWDTMIGEKVLQGNNPERLPNDLGAVAQRYGYPGKEPFVDICIKNGVCPSNLPPSFVQERCEYDVRVTHGIFLQQRDRIASEGKLGVMLTRCLLTPILADIEAQGLMLDGERTIEEWASTQRELDAILEELIDIADINWNSPKQKGEVLYQKLKFKPIKKYGKPLLTDSGNLPTSVDVVRQLKPTNKTQKRVQELLLKQSDLNAKMTKSLSKFKECVDNDDTLYAGFTQHITQTHRLSSTGKKYKAQLQNIDRRFKRLFKPKQKGWYILEADGKGLEFRVAVELGDDERGREDLRDPNFDPHTTTASVIFNEDYDYLKARLKAGDEEVDALRTDAKKHTFKPLYHGTSGTEDEQRYYQYFRDRYPGITGQQDAWKQEALRYKKVRMPWGLDFFFPNCTMSRTGYIEGSTQICNYPIQSFATADIIPIAIVYTWHEMKRRGLRSKIVNTIHDSIIVEAHPEEIDILCEIMLETFTDMCYNYLKSVYNFTFRTPLGVEIKWGTHWGEGTKENKIETTRENKHAS
jgi:DNA polymerase-1